MEPQNAGSHETLYHTNRRIINDPKPTNLLTTNDILSLASSPSNLSSPPRHSRNASLPQFRRQLGSSAEPPAVFLSLPNSTTPHDFPPGAEKISHRAQGAGAGRPRRLILNGRLYPVPFPFFSLFLQFFFFFFSTNATQVTPARQWQRQWQ